MENAPKFFLITALLSTCEVAVPKPETREGETMKIKNLNNERHDSAGLAQKKTLEEVATNAKETVEETSKNIKNKAGQGVYEVQEAGAQAAQTFQETKSNLASEFKQGAKRVGQLAQEALQEGKELAQNPQNDPSTQQAQRTVEKLGETAKDKVDATIDLLVEKAKEAVPFVLHAIEKTKEAANDPVLNRTAQNIAEESKEGLKRGVEVGKQIATAAGKAFENVRSEVQAAGGQLREDLKEAKNVSSRAVDAAKEEGKRTVQEVAQSLDEDKKSSSVQNLEGDFQEATGSVKSTLRTGVELAKEKSEDLKQGLTEAKKAGSEALEEGIREGKRALREVANSLNDHQSDASAPDLEDGLQGIAATVKRVVDSGVELAKEKSEDVAAGVAEGVVKVADLSKKLEKNLSEGVGKARLFSDYSRAKSARHEANEAWKETAESEYKKEILEDLLSHASRELDDLRLELRKAQQVHHDVLAAQKAEKALVKHGHPKSAEGALDRVEEFGVVTKNVLVGAASAVKETVEAGIRAVENTIKAIAVKASKVKAESRAEVAQERAEMAKYEEEQTKEKLRETITEVKRLRALVDSIHEKTEAKENRVYNTSRLSDLQ